MSEINLGNKVRDRITGLVGVATARCLYIHGCDHIGIQPPADNKTGKVPSLVWVDIPQVESLEESKGTKYKRFLQQGHSPGVARNKAGGPGDHPGEKAHPEYDDGVCLK